MRVDGRAIAEELYEDLRNRVGKLEKKYGLTPELAVLLVGNNPNSLAYIKQKEKGALRIGAKLSIHRLDETITTDELRASIKNLNSNKHVQAIIVQKPLPKHIDIKTIDETVIPQKDIDGFHSNPLYILALPLSVIEILKYIFLQESNTSTNAQAKNKLQSKITRKEFLLWLRKKTLVVIGKGPTGGGPTIAYLQELGISPMVVDSNTKNRSTILRKADIIVSASGKKDTVQLNEIKKGVIIIGVGMHRGEDGKLHGDYNEEGIQKKASYYTPTPGGVGPVNVACLMENVVSAAERSVSNDLPLD